MAIKVKPTKTKKKKKKKPAPVTGINVFSTSHGFILQFWTHEAAVAMIDAILNSVPEDPSNFKGPLALGFFGSEVTKSQRTELLRIASLVKRNKGKESVSQKKGS